MGLTSQLPRGGEIHQLRVNQGRHMWYKEQSDTLNSPGMCKMDHEQFKEKWQ